MIYLLLISISVTYGPLQTHNPKIFTIAAQFKDKDECNHIAEALEKNKQEAPSVSFECIAAKIGGSLP